VQNNSTKSTNKLINEKLIFKTLKYIKKEEELAMSRRNRVLIPEARSGLEKFKLEVASDLGLSNYDSIDKGELTSRQNGYVGGEMVKRMVADYESRLK
jgi:hypothetical protein